MAQRLLHKLKSFQAIIWILGISAALLILTFPLIQNTWAYFTWKRLPCRISSTVADKFFFKYNGVDYFDDARDFWIGFHNEASPAAGTEVNTEDRAGVCYVNGHEPLRAVLYLDAYKHLDHAARRIPSVLVLLAGTAMLSVLVSRRKRSAGRLKRPLGTRV